MYGRQLYLMRQWGLWTSTCIKTKQLLNDQLGCFYIFKNKFVSETCIEMELNKDVYRIWQKRYIYFEYLVKYKILYRVIKRVFLYDFWLYVATFEIWLLLDILDGHGDVQMWLDRTLSYQVFSSFLEKKTEKNGNSYFMFLTFKNPIT